MEGEPACVTLHPADAQAPVVLRCASRQEADAWVDALNAASLALGAPLVSHMGGRSPHVGGRLGAPMMPPDVTPGRFSAASSSCDDRSSGKSSLLLDDMDARLIARMAYARAPAGRMSAHRHGSGSEPPAAVRGALVLTRSVVSAAMAPLRVGAALVILPFALTIHGVAATAGAVQGLFTGGGRRVVNDDGDEDSEDGDDVPRREQGDRDVEAQPEKQALLQRFLSEDMHSLQHANGGVDADEELSLS
jgi:hypothetical protein